MYRFKADITASSQRGFVLLASLWAMVLLGVLLATMSYQVRVEATLERRFLDQSQLRLAARGAIHLAMARIRAQEGQEYHSLQDEWWATTEHWHNIELGDVSVNVHREQSPPVNQQDEDQGDDQDQDEDSTELVYGPVDGESRLNINIATVDQLSLLPGISVEIAESIVEYRESLLPPDAADAAQAKNEQDEEVVELLHGPLTSINLLLKEMGVDQAELAVQDEQQLPLDLLLTSVSSGKININTAPMQVLAALGLESQHISGLLAKRTSAPIQSVAEIPGALGLDTDSDQWESLKDLLDIRSATFELSAHASLENKKNTFVIDAFVFSDGERLRVVRWVERVSNG